MAFYTKRVSQTRLRDRTLDSTVVVIHLKPARRRLHFCYGCLQLAWAGEDCLCKEEATVAAAASTCAAICDKLGTVLPVPQGSASRTCRIKPVTANILQQKKFKAASSVPLKVADRWSLRRQMSRKPHQAKRQEVAKLLNLGQWSPRKYRWRRGVLREFWAVLRRQQPADKGITVNIDIRSAGYVGSTKWWYVIRSYSDIL